MTKLCLRSIRHFHPHIHKVYLLCDDLNEGWPDYLVDCARIYHEDHDRIEIIPYSALDGIQRCWVGWWRAQLIKLHLDMLLPGDSWFQVDGDVIFDSPIDLTDITPFSPWYNPNDNMLDQMVSQYVDHMLGRPNSRIKVEGYDFAMTSIIPFRNFDREQLCSLRDHVCQVAQQQSFLHYHCDLFYSKEIVGYVPEGDKMVMHEFELVEAWNHMARPGRYRFQMLGSGYHIMTHTAMLDGPKFRHSSLKDKDVGREWFQHQNIQVQDEIWTKVLHA